MPTLPTRSALVPVLAVFQGAEPGTVAVVRGNGGTGKSEFLDEVLAARQNAEAPTILIAARSDPSADALSAASTDQACVVVDDAHLLNDAGMQLVVALAEKRPPRAGGLIVTMRPEPTPSLARLAEIALSGGTLANLGPLSESETATICSELLGSAAPGDLIDDLLDQTQGQPLMVVPALHAWLDERENGIERSPAPEAVVQKVELQMFQLQRGQRELLLTLALAGSDTASASELLNAHPVWAAELERSGLAPLRPDGTLAPMAAEAVISAGTSSDLVSAHELLAETLSGLGVEPAAAADHFWRSRSRSPQATLAYMDAGNSLLAVEPADAILWFERAAALDPGSPDAYSGRALCHLLLGRPSEALADASDVLLRQPEHALSQAVIAGAHAQRNLWDDAAQVVEQSDPWLWFACRAIGGYLDESAPSAAPRDAFEEAASLLQATGSSDGPELADLASVLRRLAQLARDTPQEVGTPVSSHEIGAVAALALGELRLARVVLESAPPVAVRSTAMTHLKRWIEVRLGADPPPAPDDDDVDITALAVEATVARRSGDVTAGSHLARRLADVTAVRDPNLLNFDAASELIVLARRFKVSNVTEELDARLHRFLERLGNPPAWGARVAWCELEAAAAVRDVAAVKAAATQLLELATVVPGLAPLATAAHVWPSVLGEQPDIDLVRSAVAELRDSGFVWEAARLAGQAAIRIEDAGDAKSLLGEARTLRATQRNELRSEDGSSAAGLSDREVEVARHVLNGLTYKDIGEALFISAKTVEHHVSHVRRKLGVSGASRAEFLAALREDLQHL